MADYLLQEDGDQLTLEDDSGFLLLEDGTEVDYEHFLACIGCGT